MIRHIVIGTAVVAWLLVPATADAAIIFCNKFAHEVYVAIAYPQDNGLWMTRGWLSLDTGDCSTFDTAIHVKEFWYRGASVSYRNAAGTSVRMVWGNKRKFAIWENDNFQYWNAEKQVLNSTLANFSQGASSISGDVSVTVTFNANGTSITIR